MRWDIKEVGKRKNTITFRVSDLRIANLGDRAYYAVNVDWYLDLVQARCGSCQTPLTGMSSSCKHATAVRRKMVEKAPVKNPRRSKEEKDRETERLHAEWAAEAKRKKILFKLAGNIPTEELNGYRLVKV